MILVSGGSGFIGRRLVARLVESGQPVRVLARGERQAELPAGVETASGNVVTGEGLSKAAAGVEGVVHLVAIIREVRGQTFDGVIRQGTERVVEAARDAGMRKAVYVSAIGARDDPTYPYLLAKWRAEQAAINSGLNYTILRPSIIFGEGDEFINALAGLARQPIVPIAGDGRSKFQPLWVEDLVSCIAACLNDGTHDREIVEVGGPEQFTYEELVDAVMRELGVSRPKIHVPLAIMKPTARLMEWVLPRPPVTVEQLKMLALDNVTEPDAVPKSFGFQPRRLADGIGYISARG
jgi:NADH dehydrogenase